MKNYLITDRTYAFHETRIAAWLDAFTAPTRVESFQFSRQENGHKHDVEMPNQSVGIGIS